MFWFWFHFLSRTAMLGCDVLWWWLALSWLPRRSGRIALGIFMAAQMFALLSLLAGSNWPRHVPTVFLVLVMTWHYLALPFALGLALILKWSERRTGKGRRAASGPTDDDGLPRALRDDGGPVRQDARAPGNGGWSRRKFLGACAVMTPPLFNIGLTGVAVSQLMGFRIRRFTLPVPSLPGALDGMTIAHVSDIHIGRMTRGAVLKKIVLATNDLRADMVVMTGDLIDYELADLSAGIDLLKAMDAPSGLWTVEGNHDLFENAEEFRRRVRAAGISLLRNESAMTSVRGFPVQLFGLPWFNANEAHRAQFTAQAMEEMMRARHPDAFPILLAHHPHAFDEAVQRNLPLTLSGHTHGGYWMLDREHGIGSMFFKYWSGRYVRGNNQLIVSNGVGNWAMLPPIRINAPAEIVHITLRRGVGPEA